MLSTTIAIHWHDDGQPIYSLDYQCSNNQSTRLATAGGDKNVRIWRIECCETGEPQAPSVEYLSTLRKHLQAVNAVRFDRSGKYLASAGDDGLLIIWTLSGSIIQDFGVQDDEMKESWVTHQIHNTSLEIYDISWSPDSKFIAIGSMDNTMKVYNIATGQKDEEFVSHSHYVQGITWDPLNEYIATQSADRSVSIHSVATNEESLTVALAVSSWAKLTRAETPISKISRFTSTPEFTGLTNAIKSEKGTIGSKLFNPDAKKLLIGEQSDLSLENVPKINLTTKTNNLYHSENLQSFFRRLAFSPDGSMLVVPLGIYKFENTGDDLGDGAAETALLNTVYIYTRAGLNQSPVCHLPGLLKPAIAVAFCPARFELSQNRKSHVFALPYKMVFAVATHDAVVIYDTESLQPLGTLSNLHYLSITDLCWDALGRSLILSSAEGFCSVVTFPKMTFGHVILAEPRSGPLQHNQECNEKVVVSTVGASQNDSNVDMETLHATATRKEYKSNEIGASQLTKESLNDPSIGSKHAEETHKTTTQFESRLKRASGNAQEEMASNQLGWLKGNPPNVNSGNSATSKSPMSVKRGTETLEPPQKKRVTPTLIQKTS